MIIFSPPELANSSVALLTLSISLVPPKTNNMDFQNRRNICVHRSKLTGSVMSHSNTDSCLG